MYLHTKANAPKVQPVAKALAPRSHDELCELFTKAGRLDEKHAQAHYRSAVLHFEMGRNEAALRDALKAAELKSVEATKMVEDNL